MAGLKNYAGFNITDTKLQLVEISVKQDGMHLEFVDEAYFSEPLNFYDEKKTKPLSLLQSAFDELCIKKPLDTDLVSFTLPTSLFYVAQLPIEQSLFYQDLIEEFRWEFSVLYPKVNTAELLFQFYEVEPNDLNTRNTALVTALRKSNAELLKEFAEKNDLQLRYIDNVHFAADRALQQNGELRGKTVISLFFSQNVLSLEIVLNEKPVFFRLLKLKNAGEITKYIDKEIFSNADIFLMKDKIDKVYINGDNLSSAIIKALESNLGLTIERTNPFGSIIVKEELSASPHFTDYPGNFTSAAGIAYRID